MHIEFVIVAFMVQIIWHFCHINGIAKIFMYVKVRHELAVLRLRFLRLKQKRHKIVISMNCFCTNTKKKNEFHKALRVEIIWNQNVICRF